MILIVADLDDVHAKFVCQHLQRMYYRCEIFDLSALGPEAYLVYGVGAETRLTIDRAGQKSIDLQDVKSIWMRRPKEASSSQGFAAPDDKSFAAREWRHAIDGFFASSSAYFVNSPIAQINATKPLQLRLAREIGFITPETLITNDPRQVEKFLKKHNEDVVHKSITPHRSQPVFTQKWHENDRARLCTIGKAPAIFQQNISGRTDVRVTVVGDKLFAAQMEIDPDLDDTRLAPDTQYEPVELPKDISEKIFALVYRLGLVFGCIDLRIDEEGNYVFFEINPQGQFLYIEIWTGQPIGQAVAELLAGNC